MLNRIPPSLLTEVFSSISAGGSRDDILYSICRKLRSSVPHYDWVGFYIVDPDQPRTLILGPYDGAPTEHTVIPFGKGICGQSALMEQPLIVDNVSDESNYLACSIDVQSEIVIPVLKNDSYVAQLDIDSHTPGAFRMEDEEFLSAICSAVSDIF